MEVTVKKLRKTAIVYKIAPSGNSDLAGRKIVGVASVGDKNAFAGICSLSEYFPSSCWLCDLSRLPIPSVSLMFHFTSVIRHHQHPSTFLH